MRKIKVNTLAVNQGRVDAFLKANPNWKPAEYKLVKPRFLSCGFAVCTHGNTDTWACWLQLHPQKCIYHEGNRSIKGFDYV